eukprot:Seg1461.2 transcript_id=Seg1461.2/GoldUCD/mRNA.D3Y31 product="Sodium/potassium-transporting ATPase subunit beta-1-interacting protein 4" protein_id=Seg1461.2/GoldUCD/D3Y31
MAVNYIVQYQRRLLLVVLPLQLLIVLQRLVFDFLGYVWVLVSCGIIAVIFSIIGIFGTYQRKSKYLLTYVVWGVIWVILNILVIVLYLDAGSFTHKNDWLSFKQGKTSWYAKNGPGCKSVTQPNSIRTTIQGCVLKFEYVEIIQASLQIIMAIVGICLGISMRKKFKIAKDVYVVGRVNPFASYVKSNEAARFSRPGGARPSRSAITTAYP